MISHDRLRRSAIHHAAHYIDGTYLGRTTINKISNEDCLPPGVAPGAGAVVVTELGQQSFQLVGVAVNVTDDVVVQSCIFLLSQGPQAPTYAESAASSKSTRSKADARSKD